MRYVCSVIVAALAAAMFITPGYGQGAAGLSVSNYQYVSESPVTRTKYNVVYRVDLTNTSGKAHSMISARAGSPSPSATMVAGQDVVTFGPVPATGTVTSTNTFTILVDRSLPFDISTLQWTLLVPVANAGANQTLAVGSTAHLDAGGSTNPSGAGTLTYSWAFTAKPVGSGATLTNPTSLQPTFVVDMPGNYTVGLTVSNGFSTDTSSVAISTINSPPTANAGPNQTVALGTTAHLNGSGSTDPDGDPLTFSWIIKSSPTGSTAVLSGATTPTPSFVVDKPGTYTAQLIVNDGHANSLASTVNITTLNTAPVANAGPDQSVALGALVQLTGAGSTDADGNPLTYHWTMNGSPTGSTATLSNANIVNPTFTADKPGTYLVQLVVNDGQVDSLASNVHISTNPLVAPTANAGQNQTVVHGTTVHLDGSASTDPQHLPLTYLWSLSKPNNSNATISAPTSVTPTFVADVPGTYVAQLIVNNGTLASAASTATITTTNTPPVANAGQAQSVSPGTGVNLNGSGSSDADGDTLTYSWSLTHPAGSLATLTNANTISPSFFADIAGTYIAQLIVSDPFTSSLPVTVTITAGSKTISLSPKPLNLSPGTAGSLTVSIGAPAGPGGQAVGLQSGDTNVVSVPLLVTIPEGQSGINATVTPGNTGSTVITAVAGGFTGDTVTVNVAPSAAISLSVASPTVGVTRSMNGTVTLSSAPASPVTVALSASPAGFVSVPASVTVPAGSTTAPFQVTGLAVGSATITGTAAGYSSGTVNAAAAMLGAITLAQGVVVGLNTPVDFPVSIVTGAPVGGVTITLTSDAPSKVTISPGSVFIDAGNTTPSIQPKVTGVGFGSANISASAGGFFGDKQLVQVSASLNFTQQSVTVGVGGNVTLNLNLSGPAPSGGLTVNLNSSNTAVATVASTATFAANSTTVNVPVSAIATGSAAIHASGTGLADVSANINVVSLGAVNLPAGSSVGLGQTVAFPISLPQAAPAGGVTVTLGSTDTSKLTISPGSVNIAAGQTTPAVQPTVTGVALGTANINASAPGYGSAGEPVQVNATVTLTPQTLTINGAGTQNLTLTLSANAPAGGITVNLSSDNTAVATVGQTATIPAGQNTVQVPVTAVSAGSSVIHASKSPSIADATANVTVQSSGGIGLPANTTVPLGGTATFTVTLPSAPSSNVTVTLTSGDTSKVTLTSGTVTVLSGQTTGSTQVNGVNIGSANITATAPGYTQASAPVQVNATITFTQPTLTLVGTETQNLSLTLSANAPAGGLTVNLNSSNTVVATVPATATFAAGSNSATVPVTGVTPGAAVIHASNTPNIPDVTANVSVQTPGSIILPANPTVALGASAPFNISLATPAPTAVTLTVASGDTSKVSVSPGTVTIAAGATAPAVQPQVTGVNLGSAAITVSGTGYNATSATVQVNATMTFASPNVTISGLVTQNVALNLSANAPAGGITVGLTSSSPSVATVPLNVNIAAGTNTVNVPVTAVSIGGPVVITASTTAPNLPSTTTNVTVQAAGAIGLPASTSVALGGSTTFTVTLPSAPSSNVTVTLTSGDTSKVTLAAGTVTVLAGQTTASTQVNGINIGSANVTATAPGYGQASAPVQVNATVNFTQSTLTVPVNTTQNLTLNLSANAPAGGLTVNVTSSNTAAATVPATVQFTAGTNSVTVPVLGVAAGSSTISAGSTPNIPLATSAVTVQAPGTIVLPVNPTVGLGATVPFAVTLGSPAPAAVSITLTSSDNTRLTISPGSVNIAAGATTPAVQPQITGVNLGSANISASGTGYTGASVAVQIGATLSFASQTVTISGLTTQNVALNLSANAPQALTFNLTSGNPGVATVPGSVNIAAGTNTVNVPVTAVAIGGPVTITATAVAPNIPAATTAVTVQSAGAISLPASTTVGLGASASYVVTLPSAPASNVTVTLVSSDTSKVTLTSGTVTVLAGQTTATAQVNGVGLGSANITATASGYTQAVAPVQVNATLSWGQPNYTISGFTTQNLTLNLSGNAPAAGLTVNLNSDNSANATVGATATFAGGTNTVQVPVTGVHLGTAGIHASLTPSIPDVATTVTVQSAGAIGVPATLSVGLGATAALNVSIPAAAPAGGVTVTLTSSDTTKATVPASVLIPAGATTPPAQPLVTGVSLGTGTTISAVASGYTSGSTAVTVTGTIVFSPNTLTVTGLTTQNATLNLSGTAPAGGIVINLSSDNTAVATVPATVTIAAGTNAVSVPVTTKSVASTVIHASGANLADTTLAVTVTPAGPIVVPVGTPVQLGGSASFAISLPVPAPTGGLTVSLVSSDPNKVSVTPSVTVAAGQITPATQPVINGLDLGTATITASATGYGNGTGGVTITGSVSFGGTDVTLAAFTTQNITLTLSGPAPAGGITVQVVSSDPTVATVPTSVTFLQHQSTVSIPVTTLKVGATSISVTGANLTGASVNVSVLNISLGTLTVGSVNVGQNMEAQVTITIDPAPVSGLLVTLTSGDSGKLILGQSPRLAGGQSVVFQVPAGVGVVSAYAQGLVPSGTVSMTATALGWTSGSGTATLFPGGFVIAGPTGVVGVPTFPTNVGVASTLTVSSARLDSSNNFAEFQPVRGGLTVDVPISSSNTSLGTVLPTTVTFNGLDSSFTTQFTAKAAGNPTITAGVPATPAGFTQPASGANVLTANITAAGLTPGNATVGKGLEAATSVLLNGVPASDIFIDITSNDPTKFVLSATPTGPGTSTISVKVKAGLNHTPDFYVYGLATSGAATYTASGPGFGTANGTVALQPSGVVIAGPFGFGYGISTTSLSSPTPVTVYSALLDSAHGFVATQAVAGDVSVHVTSSNTTVGTIVTSPVTIAAGTDRVITQFQPNANGTSTLSIDQPMSATPAQYTSVLAIVATTGIALSTDDMSLGRFLQTDAHISLGAAAPTGGATVTLTSNSPNLKLSTSPTVAGSSSITVQINAGDFGGEADALGHPKYAFYVQALDSTGTASYTASANGYVSRTSTLNLAPAGVVIWDGLSVGGTLFATPGGVDNPVYVSTGPLDSGNNFQFVQQLAPGHTVSVTLSSTGSGTLTPSTVVINPGSDTSVTQFKIASSGSATISIVGGPPAGFVTPAKGATLSVFAF